MIILHKLNGQEFVLNADHIETIEEKPDTTITLVNEKKYLVQEKKDVIIDKAVEYYSRFCSSERFK